MVIIEKIKEMIISLTNNFDPHTLIHLGIDCVLVLGALIWAIIELRRKKLKAFKVIVAFLLAFVLYLVCIVLEFKFFKIVVVIFAAYYLMTLCNAYSQDLRHSLENTTNTSKNTRSFSSAEEKKAVITTICSTAQYLSKRKIGALITIERNDSLDEYIQNAIDIRAVLTQEIMTTIFTPGTACHDGAIIVRKNIIMCAGAYYPSTLKYDVPKALGSRHRAAIGISEKVDALTVVVSEQTGNISVTLDGIIYSNLSNTSLQEMLENHLLEEEAK